ncbi:MAG: GAF domain-containing protein, partial [Marmoricola sp.]
MTTTPPSASFFAQVSQELMRIGEERPTLQSVVERAVEVVPACDWASVTLRRARNRTETVAASSDIARSADQLQYDLQEGPCLEAALTGEPRLSNRLAESEDWPRWGPKVTELGVNALLGIELSTDDEVLGALNLYSADAGAFTREDIDIADVYAAHATNALTAARLSSGLRTAL